MSRIWLGVLCLGRSMRFVELDFSVEYSLVRAPPSGGGSNAPRPAVSVPHIDVNADGCRARQARNCKNTACRGGISEISGVSLDYVCNAWMIYLIGIISKPYLIVFGVWRWHTIQRLFLCCTFLLVRLVSCPALLLLLFLLVLPAGNSFF